MDIEKICILYFKETNNNFKLTLKAEVEQGSTGQFSTPWVTQHLKP